MCLALFVVVTFWLHFNIATDLNAQLFSFSNADINAHKIDNPIWQIDLAEIING